MILFQCQCGAGCHGEDESAGKEFVCHGCGARMLIPSESASNLVLIFATGTAEDGDVITLQQLATGIANGRYCGGDLIWKDGIWKELDSVYEIPEQKKAAANGNDPEIALHFSDLPPAPDFTPLSRRKLNVFWGRSSVRRNSQKFLILFILLIFGYVIYRAYHIWTGYY